VTVAVGFFDGVHLGHQAILKGADRALTFKTHPLSLLAPDRAPKLIMSLDERLAAIRSQGVGEVAALDFTPELAEMSRDDFAAQYLSHGGEPMSVRCGANWHFGKGGEGDADWLRSRGVSVAVVPFAELDGERISSSRIRMALGRGEIAAAAAMLGRDIVVRGENVAGKGEGRSLGFPTVNLKLASPLVALLPKGVYVVEVTGGVRAIANFGFAPTFAARAWPEPILEVHFPGRDSVPFNWTDAAVKLVSFVRPERKFSSLEELRQQIALDCAKCQ